MTKSLLKIKTMFAQGLAQLTILAMVVFLVPGGLFAQESKTVALDDSAIAPPNGSVIIDVLANDTPGSGSLDLTTITNTTTPQNGTVVINTDGNTNGTFTYTPNTNFIGPDSFDYEVCDTAPEPSCDTATVDIVVAIEVPFNVIPKKLNVKKKGALPVVIQGIGDIDVTMINPESLRLEDVPSLRWNMGSKKLTLKFSAKDIVAAIGEVNDGDVVVLQLRGNLNADAGGDEIAGQDTVIILKKGKH